METYHRRFKGKGFLIYPDEIIKNRKLSAGAKDMYVNWCRLANFKEEITTKYLAEHMEVSEINIQRWKRELKRHGLLKVIQIGPRRFRAHLATVPGYFPTIDPQDEGTEV